MLYLNVSKVNFESQKINSSTIEIQYFKHPHLIEIVDTTSNVNQFLETQKNFLEGVQVMIVKSEVLVR